MRHLHHDTAAVAAACDAIAAADGPVAVTLRAVLRRLGGGAAAAVHEGVRAWHAARGVAGGDLVRLLARAVETERRFQEGGRGELVVEIARLEEEVASLVAQLGAYALDLAEVQEVFHSIDSPALDPFDFGALESEPVHELFDDLAVAEGACACVQQAARAAADAPAASGTAATAGASLLAALPVALPALAVGPHVCGVSVVDAAGAAMLREGALSAEGLACVVGEVAAGSDIFVAGVQIRPDDVASFDFMLPALLVEAAARTPGGWLRAVLQADDAALLGYRVVVLDADVRHLRSALALIVSLYRVPQARGADEIVLDSAVRRFAEWLGHHGLDAWAVEDVDVRVAVRI